MVMKTTEFWTLFLVMLLGVSRVFAQESYTFSESIEILLKRNAELRAVEESVESAKAQLYSAYGNFLPTVSANLNYNRDQSGDNTSENYGAGISLNANLFRGFADSANLDDARAKLEVAEANLKRVKAKLSYDLKASFAELSFAHENLKLAESIRKRRADNLSLVELRFQSGRENKGSVLLSTANVKESVVDYKRAQFNLQDAKAHFVRVLGLTPGFDADIKGGAPEVMDAGAPNFVELAQAVPDRVISASQLKSAEASLVASRSGFYPQLSVGGSLSSSGLTYFPEDQKNWNVGATLSWNLFNGGKDYFASKSAFANKISGENNLRNLDLDLVWQLRQAYTAFVLAIEELDVRKDVLEAQGVRAEIGRGKYNNGLSTFDDWDKIENDLIASQKSLIEKRRAKALAEAAWEKAQGKGVLP